MVAVRFLPRAEKQLRELSPELQDEILEKADSLAMFPRMGPVMKKTYFGFRYLLAGGGRYRIIYKVTSVNLLEIAYIRHCRRQMGLRLVT